MKNRGNIIVLGSGGMLGRTFMRSREGIFGLDYPEVDLTLKESLRGKIASLRPEIIINCAGYTDVDRAESNPESAFAINHLGTLHLAEIAKEIGAQLIHFSTDYVFHNERRVPFKETDPPNPRGVYARSKLDGENALREIGGNFLLIRTAWLFGHGGKNFVEAIINLASSKPELRVVNDQLGRPTYTEDLTQAVWKLIEMDASGVFHVCNHGEATWFDFAREIIRQSGLSVRLEPQTTAELGRPAPRPPYSVLDCGKFEEACGSLPSWQDALKRYLARRAGE